MQGQQTSNNRRSTENLQGNNGGGNGSSSTWTSPQASSSFSRFQDIEVPLGGTTELNDDAKEKSLRRRSLLDERAARRRSLLSSYAADDVDRRRSLNSSSNLSSPNSKLRPSGSSSLLGVVESHQTPLPQLLKVSADSFEQWLKLATDNVSVTWQRTADVSILQMRTTIRHWQMPCNWCQYLTYSSFCSL